MIRLHAGTVRTVALTVAVAVAVGTAVLLAVGLRDVVYQGRVGLVASPVTNGPAAEARYGEVVALTLPALVELTRSPSVLGAAAASVPDAPGIDELAKGVAVELVPASGLARLSVRAPSEHNARILASAIARAMIDADLLAPVGRLRLLDERVEISRVAPDPLLAAGLALAAAVTTAVAILVLRRTVPFGRRDGEAVRDALVAAGARRSVPVLRVDDPVLTARLAMLGEATARPLRVLAVDEELAGPAKSLSERLGAQRASDRLAGAAVVAMTRGGGRQDGLTAAVGVLPENTLLAAVVVA
ncbi:hypothetical protein [Amycolatopsis anabasis]|uniref:hypothetical protein n=1 Tax=Amycolatopsis anabasis TaxID=1840409 RepID=UPI001FE6C9B7|nr:hypothetical protein [Amycolatopsis anabasis]